MKQISLSFLLASITFCSAWAQTNDITFVMDLSSLNDPSTRAHISGDFNDHVLEPMTPIGDDQYELTVSITGGWSGTSLSFFSSYSWGAGEPQVANVTCTGDNANSGINANGSRWFYRGDPAGGESITYAFEWGSCNTPPMVTQSLVSWTGSTSTDWFTAANWSGNAVPDNTIDVAIIGSTNQPVISGADAEVNELIVYSDATLNISAGASLEINNNANNMGTFEVASGASLLTTGGTTVTGDITIKRSTRYSDGKYSFVGTPVAQNSSITGSDLGSSVYKYNESTAFGVDGLSKWEDASSDELAPGVGYTQANQLELTFSGIPNAGTITVSGSYTQDVDDATEGFNLVANPYAAAIGFAAFMIDNTNNTGSVYIWDDNGSNLGRGSSSDYIIINASGNTNSTAGNLSRYNGYIGSSQGFFVQLTDGAGTNIVFEEDQRVKGNNADGSFFRTESSIKRLRVNLTHPEGLFRQTLIAWNENINDDKINRLYDAAVFNQDAEYSIYTVKNDKPLAIQTITSSVKHIQLGINTALSGDYSLDFDDTELDEDMYLVDTYMDRVVNIADGSYSFYTEAGKATDRFRLYAEDKVLSTALDQEWEIVHFDNKISITPVNQLNSTFRIYSLSGRLVKTSIIIQPTVIEMNVDPGIYIVTNGIVSAKVSLK